MMRRSMSVSPETASATVAEVDDDDSDRDHITVDFCEDIPQRGLRCSERDKRRLIGSFILSRAGRGFAADYARPHRAFQ